MAENDNAGVVPMAEALDILDGIYQTAFLGHVGEFTWVNQTIPDFNKNIDITKFHFGVDALDVVHGVAVGGAEGPAVLFTGNSPFSPARARFLTVILTNWPEISDKLRRLEAMDAEKKETV